LLKNAIEALEKDPVNQTNKIAIFDVIEERVYNVVHDSDLIKEKLKEMDILLKDPTFHPGDIRHKIVEQGIVPGDSLKYTMDRYMGSSPGSGIYTKSNFYDDKDWIS
jgi:hypothetical protein